MTITRLALAVPTEPRTAALDKDALLQNAFIDTDANTGVLYATKRPGFYVGSEAITTGLNRGIYVNPNNVTGGTPGEVEIWYIGGGLQSFSYNPFVPPPTEGFRDFEFDIFLPTGTPPQGIDVYQYSSEPIDGEYLQFSFRYTFDSIAGILITFGTNIDPNRYGILGQAISLLPGTHNVRVFRDVIGTTTRFSVRVNLSPDGGEDPLFFYMYVENALPFVTPYLDSDIYSGDSEIQNLHFLN